MAFRHSVIGVMPQSFHLPSSYTLTGAIGSANSHGYAEALVPLAFTKDELKEVAGDFDYPGIARLKPGISAAQAQAELNGLQHTISAGLSANDKMTLSAILIPFQQYLVGNNSKPLIILLVAVAGLLFVGCINIMNLLLARAVGRRQEMAVASALGASRSDLLRASMREAGVLAAIGGALGILLAAMIVPILQRFLPADAELPRQPARGLDGSCVCSVAGGDGNAACRCRACMDELADPAAGRIARRLTLGKRVPQRKAIAQNIGRGGSRRQRHPRPDDGIVDRQPLPPDACRARLSDGSRD